MPPPYFLFLLSFLEGGTVMAAELLGAKMLAPYFGASLYVWTTTLALTLGALTSGYLVGGLVSVHPQRLRLLYGILTLAAGLTALMPFTATWILNRLIIENLILGLLLAGALFIVPPIFLMGMVSPLIIAELSESQHSPGQAAGMVYAISTLGGIVYTFVFGFWIIPTFGIRLPAICGGLLLGVLPLSLWVRRALAGATLVAVGVAWGLMPTPMNESNELSVLLLQEGLLGQVMVTEYRNPATGQPETRALLVNRSTQTEYFMQEAQSYSKYAHMLAQTAAALPGRKSTLVLGLGGGAIANLLLHPTGFETVEACELDRRIYEAARQFFKLDHRIKVTIDDARHHLRRLTGQYDLIVFDLFRGEESPEHVITQESLTALQSHLSAQGALLINSHGYVSGTLGQGNRAIYRTLQASGFQVQVLASTDQEASSNNVFVATLKPIKPLSLSYRFVPAGIFKDPQALLLTDDRPVLNLLNTQVTQIWRQAYIRGLTYYQQQQVPLFR